MPTLVVGCRRQRYAWLGKAIDARHAFRTLGVSPAPA